LSLARSSLLYPSLLASSSIDKKTAMAGEFELCLVFFLLLFFSPPSSAALVLYWLLIRLLCGEQSEQIRFLLARICVHSLCFFFLRSLLSGVGLWIWFGLVWFFFVWMGKDFVLELICVRASFPSVARHMTAACIRSSISNVLGFFW
jgi:hypothetical protein